MRVTIKRKLKRFETKRDTDIRLIFRIKIEDLKIKQKDFGFLCNKT
jgi:hypothetical protein